MLISPPFLPPIPANATTPDPMMDAVDKYATHFGTYPIAFDRRWHCGQHLDPGDQTREVRAIADGEVVAYRVCQKAISDGAKDQHGVEILNSNLGFVLLKHTTETGDNRKLTYFSLYMHLLDLDGMSHLLGNLPEAGSAPHVLPDWLRMPTGDALSGGDKKVYRKDVLGYLGKCHDRFQLHFEIFMLPADYTAYFETTQLDVAQPVTPTATDYWGHTYYVIPAGQTFYAQPPGVGSDNKLHGIEFDPLQGGQNERQVYVESYFHKGDKYTTAWNVADDGTRTVLVRDQPEPNYEYDLYKRATSLYPACPSDGYELLRFGRILSNPATLADGAARATWTRVTFETGKDGYVDINNVAVAKLSDADFPAFMHWKKISEGDGPFNSDGLCDVGQLRTILGDAHIDPISDDTELKDVEAKNDEVSRYLNDPDNAYIREQLRGFICEAPTEWNASNVETRYAKLLDVGEYFEGKDAAYTKFIKFAKQFCFWDKTGLGDTKLCFFNPLQFVRHFRKCGWLSANELTGCLPRSSLSGNIPWDVAHGRALQHYRTINNIFHKYLNSCKGRLLHFLAQTFIETGCLRTVREDSLGHGHAYGPFYGRGYLQLTWPANYENYKKYKCINNLDSGPYTDPRITPTSTHVWADGAPIKRWAPSYDPEIVAAELDHAAESSGMFWLAKSFRGTRNINRAADLGASPSIVGFISWLINGGGTGYRERQQYAVTLEHILLDTIRRANNEVLRYPALTPPSHPLLCSAFPPVAVPFSQSITIDYAPQVP